MGEITSVDALPVDAHGLEQLVKTVDAPAGGHAETVVIIIRHEGCERTEDEHDNKRAKYHPGEKPVFFRG